MGLVLQQNFIFSKKFNFTLPQPPLRNFLILQKSKKSKFLFLRTKFSYDTQGCGSLKFKILKVYESSFIRKHCILFFNFTHSQPPLMNFMILRKIEKIDIINSFKNLVIIHILGIIRYNNDILRQINSYNLKFLILPPSRLRLENLEFSKNRKN